jgi:hypothetical protein
MILEYTKYDVEGMHKIASEEIKTMQKNILMLEGIIENCHKDLLKNVEVANRYLNEGKIDIYEFFTRESIPGSRRLMNVCRKTIDECKLSIHHKEERIKHYQNHISGKPSLEEHP